MFPFPDIFINSVHSPDYKELNVVPLCFAWISVWAPCHNNILKTKFCSASEKPWTGVIKRVVKIKSLLYIRKTLLCTNDPLLEI